MRRPRPRRGRCGLWLDPDHQFRAPRGDSVARALLPGGEDQVHYAVGLGVGFDRFQIDLAVDLSERRDTVALSAIYSF